MGSFDGSRPGRPRQAEAGLEWDSREFPPEAAQEAAGDHHVKTGIFVSRWAAALWLVAFVIVPTVKAQPPSPTRKTDAAEIARLRQETSAGVARLEQWRVPASGLYAQPTGWWNAANIVTTLVNYARVTGDRSVLAAVDATFERANAANKTNNFLNEYNDDEGWWALAWIDAYDLTRKPKYLAMAKTIFADMAAQWEEPTCGGGIWWSKKDQYKNAIANELFLAVAASLANRDTDRAARARALDWAHREWTWLEHSGMINAQNLFNDGLKSKNPKACTNNGQNTWTYNQGVILGGLVELARADKNPALLQQADAIASAAIAHLVTPEGVLTEQTVHGGDAPQFKGIFVRNLMLLHKAAPQSRYKAFLLTNAQSIVAHAAPDHAYGGNWEAVVDSADATRQSSALDALVAALAMR